MELPKYPEMDRIATLRYPQMLLGQVIHWTEKRDGSQLRISLDEENNLVISTHHQDNASDMFKDYFWKTEQPQSVKDFLIDTNGYREEPVANFDFGSVVFGELLCKGKSPARFETHDKYEFVIFDIFSLKDQRFLPYTSVYQHCYHYNLPVVECWAISKHLDLDSLYAYRDEMLIVAKEKAREGVVLKNYHDQVFAKEKLDTPKIERVKIEDGSVRLPPLPDSEVFGAIAKVHADIGEGFIDKRIAMPLVAQYIGQEQEKHQCSKPRMNLFTYYQLYLRDRIAQVEE